MEETALFWKWEDIWR